MNKSKIEWCDYTWNPVTGCLHDCPYCYARKIANRFDGHFNPTFHEDRLIQPQKIKKPSNIFVCSMADLFGYWVPDEWITQVFEASIKAPQHNYLFLTKNPKRYTEIDRYMPSNMWFGATYTNRETAQRFNVHHSWNTFVSIEPILEPFVATIMGFSWVIVGAETGNRKNKVAPKREWIEEIMQACRDSNTPLFMKNSLRDLMGDDFVQEFPKGIKEVAEK